MEVGIIKSSKKRLDQDITRLLEIIDYKPKKNKIFIKPNLVYAAQYKKGITSPVFLIEALVRYFKKFNCEIIIGEGSAVGHDTKKVFKKLGYEKLIKKYDIKLADLNYTKRKKFNWKYGKIELPELIKEYEYINVANFKTHTMTTATLGMKNQKGLLLPKDKKNFHWLGLHKPIKELNKIISPDLTIISGFYCLEGNSTTIINKTKKLNILVAGKDVKSVDNACLEIMGIDKVEHIPKTKYMVVGTPIEEIKDKFILAEKTRKILKTEFMLKGCSGCSVNTEKALKSLLKKPFK